MQKRNSSLLFCDNVSTYRGPYEVDLLRAHSISRCISNGNVVAALPALTSP